MSWANEYIAILWLFFAVILDVIANILLKKSCGFKHKKLGCLSLLLVSLAFTALAQATKSLDLAVAYALWGGFGLLATVFMGRILFGERLHRMGRMGVVFLLLGMTIIKLAE